MRRPEIVKRIKEAVSRTDPRATVIVYGSEARGNARPDSDIDVMILVDGNHLTVSREEEYTAPLYDIEWETGVLISPMVMLRKEWENRPMVTPFYLNVRNEGVMICRGRMAAGR